MEDPSPLYSMTEKHDDQFSLGTTLIDQGDHDDDDGDDKEESGWTTYLQDLSNVHPSSSAFEDDHSCFRSSTLGVGTSSLISDAASPYHDLSNLVLTLPPNYGSNYKTTGPRKLSLAKKMQSKKITEEDPLEDTASSPVSSPKVDDFRKMDRASLKRDESFGPSFFANRASSYLHHKGVELEITDGKNDQMGLKDRGLCLVPLSLFTNYLG